MKQKIGKIIANGVSLEKHENDMALVFVRLGFDVELIPPSYTKGQKTADAIISGIAWEFKSPQGDKRCTLDNTLGRAAKQSENIIIDLRRMPRADRQCIAELRKIKKWHRGIKRLKVITKKDKKIIDIQ